MAGGWGTPRRLAVVSCSRRADGWDVVGTCCDGAYRPDCIKSTVSPKKKYSAHALSRCRVAPAAAPDTCTGTVTVTVTVITATRHHTRHPGDIPPYCRGCHWMAPTHYLGIELSGHSGCIWRWPGVPAGTYGPASALGRVEPTKVGYKTSYRFCKVEEWHST